MVVVLYMSDDADTPVASRLAGNMPRSQPIWLGHVTTELADSSILCTTVMRDAGRVLPSQKSFEFAVFLPNSSGDVTACVWQPQTLLL